MVQKFIESGYEIVNQHEKADIYVINTCTVTNMSDRKSRQMLRRVKEINNQAIVVACGCYAQVAKSELEKIEEIDLILGNNEKKEIVKYVEEFAEKNENSLSCSNAIVENSENEPQKLVEIEDVMYKKEFVDFGDVTYTEKTRAVIKVQDGCDRFCSYCIIPYARGRVRSRKPESIISEIKKIAKEGIKEVVITGIHVASYGKDFKFEENKKQYRLIDLLEEINKINGIERIRLGSIEPLLINEEFMKRLTKLEKICHHFHLSLQSGCDETLKRMNRRYTTEQFRKIVSILRKNYNDVILTTDIIVGFPGETEKEFEETYQFLKEIKFYKMHIFKYSPRKGTKAAAMKEQIDGNKKEQRSQRLIELSNVNEKEYNESYVGQTVQVLFEEEKDGVYKGHTKNYVQAYLFKDKEQALENRVNTEGKVLSKIENEIVEVTCYKAEQEYIIVRI